MNSSSLTNARLKSTCSNLGNGSFSLRVIACHSSWANSQVFVLSVFKAGMDVSNSRSSGPVSHRSSAGCWSSCWSIVPARSKVSIGTGSSIALSCSIVIVSGLGFPSKTICLLFEVGNRVERCDPGEIVQSTVRRVL
ncbi:hypothetical protein V565_166770 [Rhizoctonia solani 123E]|uniref:Uncharacterized protein n=1 Tax=Rhizoctonia solani 123E TaxID=1423351 RepID=A0A074RP60_9AGAM|nr:hypothetical protein V565_166770 [Rhizoctonia solani 123E]